MSLTRLILALAVAFVGFSSLLAADKKQAYTDSENADADFAYQGEYVGEKTGEHAGKWGVQVIALGDHNFRAVGYPGGLPGDGWNMKEKKSAEGKLEGETVVIKTKRGATLRITPKQITVVNSGGEKVGELKKVHRESPTLGTEPPKGAVVLYGGPDDADKWQNGKSDEDGNLQKGVMSKQKFGDHKLHIEFRLPYQPNARGQGRGNSGLYVQGRHEIQMLDSFGLEGKDNECGGIYKVSEPRVNMCYPPLSWQTYDVDFTAAKYDGDKKVSNARITVKHNGVVIHEDLEVPKATAGGRVKEGPEPGPVYLQDHGNPVVYRNIWVVEK